MAASKLEMTGSPIEMSSDESNIFSFDPSALLAQGESVSSESVKAYEVDGGADVTGIILGTTSVVSDVIQQVVSGLTKGKSYRIEVKFTAATDKIWEGYIIINCVK